MLHRTTHTPAKVNRYDDARNGSMRHCLFFGFVGFFFSNLFNFVSCSFVFLILFPFVVFCFLCFFMFDVPINFWNLDEYFYKTIKMTRSCTVMSILCVPLKPNTFKMSFPEMIMIANVFTSQKHQISKKNTNEKCWVLKQNWKTM